jgi:folate-binding protein YgfZ
MSSFTTLLSDRRLLGLTGPDVVEFMQGVCTQNCLKLQQDAPAYGLHLTPQGRFLYDFILIQREGILWLDCHAPTAMGLAKALHNYKLRYNLEFHDLGDDYSIYAAVDDAPTLPEGSLKVTDPRLPALGQRLYVPKAAELACTGRMEDYTAHRLRLGVPDGAYDCFPDKSFPNEYCFADLKGIDYKKGCYVGQELTARTHFRTKPRKYVMQVTFAGPAPAVGTEVMRGGLKIGTMLSSLGQQGLALLRVSEVAKGEAITASETVLQAIKPSWATYEAVTD